MAKQQIEATSPVSANTNTDILREKVDPSLAENKTRNKRKEKWVWFHGLRYELFVDDPDFGVSAEAEAKAKKREEGEGTVTKLGRLETLPIPVVIATWEESAASGKTLGQLAAELGYSTYNPAKMRATAHKAYKAYNGMAEKLDKPTKDVPVIMDGANTAELNAMFA